jgi:protein-S-isoprenylcysteine O-methyltransferase Ste14
MPGISCLVLAITIWGVVHSILASNSFKDFCHRVFGAGFMRVYRLGYNIFAALSFLPILYLMAILPDQPLYSISSPWNYLMLAVQALSAVMLLVGILQTDTLSFVGLRQLFEEEKSPQLVTRGLYRYVRHPLYTFGLLTIWLSSSVSINSFVVYVAATIYTLVGAYFEERKLLREFGQSYADYKRVTPMLIPFLKFGENK